MIRIGTRSSELALYQANTVARLLEDLGHKTTLVKIDSLGDQDLKTPLYELGVTGVFTKNLDVALLNKKIDIAVHSFKDVPTQLPKGTVQAAVLKRGNHKDVLILKKDENFFENRTATIATGSLRRKAQWLYRYPNHTITNLRGNVNTRLQKLADNPWDGAIFAVAGLGRINLLPKKEKHVMLDWMVPAPAQGAIMVACLEENQEVYEACRALNHEDTELCVNIEREFLRVLEGGCTAPIGAIAKIKEDSLSFKGVLFSPDGKKKIEFSKIVERKDVRDLGTFAANYILDRGGKKLMRKSIQLEKEINVYSTKYISKDQANSLPSHIGVAMSDFISIKNTRVKPKDVKDPIKHAIFTSKNAVESLLFSHPASALQLETIYCVGRKTKRFIERKIGTVAHVAPTAKDLAIYLIERHKKETFTFFCGNKRRDELPNLLQAHDHQVVEIECYRTSLSPKKIEDSYQGVLFYSPSGIESYLQANNSNNLVAFCIGETTANEARNHFKTVVVSIIASVSGVLDSVKEYYKKQ